MAGQGATDAHDIKPIATVQFKPIDQFDMQQTGQFDATCHIDPVEFGQCIVTTAVKQPSQHRPDQNRGRFGNHVGKQRYATPIAHATVGDEQVLPIKVADGALSNNGGSTLTNNGGLTNQGTLTNKGGLTNSGTLYNKADGTLDNHASLTINTGTLTNQGVLNNWAELTNYGTLNNESGGTLDNESGGTLINNGGSTLTNNGGLTNWGGLINNGTIDTTNGTFTNNGTLNGSGHIKGSYTDHGHIKPGNSAGVMTIDGDYFKVAGSKEIELGGLFDGGGDNALAEFDRIDVTGSVELSGLLHVKLIDGFKLHRGNWFDIMRVGGTLSGQYDGLGEGALVGNFGGQDLFITYGGMGDGVA